MAFTDEEVNRILYSGRRRGRKRLPLSERRYSTSVTISPQHADYAVAQAVKAGHGTNLSGGIAACIARCLEQDQAALEAIKAAAERRDQEAVRSQGSAFDD
jgi:hypothetical protein